MTNQQKLQQIDDILSFLEDMYHKEDGGKIAAARTLTQELMDGVQPWENKSNIIKGDNFRLDLHEFAKVSTEVGFYNCMSNILDENENLDEEAASKLEELRGQHIDMFEEILAAYSI